MMVLRWLRWSARKAPAPSAGGPSPAAQSDLSKTPPTGDTSPSVRIIASGSPAAPPSACPGAPAASSPASWTDAQVAERITAAPAGDLHGLYAAVMAIVRGGGLVPPELPGIPGGTMLAVAPVPGKILEEWRHAAMGVWIAWPHAADAIHAEEMTAAQLRAILAARDTP